MSRAWHGEDNKPGHDGLRRLRVFACHDLGNAQASAPVAVAARLIG
jgi:hypothetical protein